MSNTALITGGTSGIGLATARHFVRQGFSLVVCGRNAERLSQARQDLRQLASEHPSGGKIVIESLPCDLQDIQQCSQLAGRATEILGGIDILVNNAAAAPLCQFETTSIEDFEQVLSINLRASWTVTQEIWKGMVSRKSGAIVNVSSMAAVDPYSGFSLYGASKGWIETWTRALADEGIRKGIRVYGVRPGAVETPLLRRLFPDFPADQCVSPEEVARTIYDLAVNQTHAPGTILTVAAETSNLDETL